jgi:hypothetical protein
MIGYSREEIVEKVQQIAEGMDKKTESIEKLKASLLMDRGRLEELKNLHNMIVAAEQAAEEEEKPKPKKKAPVKKRAKK